jgi:hypothetical protein
MRVRGRFSCALVTMLTLGGLIGAASASAVTVGQVLDGDVGGTCIANLWAQTNVVDGTTYTMPADGVVTSYSTRDYARAAGTRFRLVIFRSDPAAPGHLIVVGVSDTRIDLPLAPPSSPLTMATAPIAVRAGDFVGFLLEHNDAGTQCLQSTPDGDTYRAVFYEGVPPVGQSILMGDPISPGFHGLRFSVVANLVASGCDLARTPVGCWGFNEPLRATRAFDVSGAGNHGVYANNPTLGVPGVRSTAVQVDGVNDVVRVPDAASLDIGPAFTAEAWVRRTSAAQSVDLMNKGAGGIQLVVMGASSGSQVFLRKAGVTTIAHSLNGVPADGAYHQVVATMNGAGTAKVYIDGAPDGLSVSALQVLQGTAFPLTLGAPSGTVASLDEFGLYRQALTAAEVHAHYVAGHSPPPA